MKTLIIDNYDSFTFNLYQLTARVNGENPVVIRNDRLTAGDILRHNIDNIILSPGPGSAVNKKDFGVCLEIILTAEVPILGVCLGHQGIGYAFGGRVEQAPEVMHGRISNILHSSDPLFHGIPESFRAVRYHSLILADPLPPVLEKTAWSDDGLIMGLRHRTKPLLGVQFHPESICTEHGERLLSNFKKITEEFIQKQQAAKPPVTIKEENWQGVNIIPTPQTPSHGPSQYRVGVKKLDCFPDPQELFDRFYREDPYAFWLDSSKIVEGFSRFSFMGGSSGPHFEVVTYDLKSNQVEKIFQGSKYYLKESIFDYLSRELRERSVKTENLPFPFAGGYVGYLGYELKSECGSDPNRHQSEDPDAVFLFADRYIAFDHKEKQAYLLSVTKQGETEQWLEKTEEDLKKMVPLPQESEKGGEVEIRLLQEHDTYIENIKTCQKLLKEGESYEICLTNRYKIRASVDPLNFYRRLRSRNAAPYSAYLRLAELYIACSSPERFLTIDSAGNADSRPMKGTLPRGKNAEEDRELRKQLETSEKERSENLMICDLIRNDLGMVSEIGSIEVPRLMVVESYATVHQMVSVIRGKLRAGITALEAVKHAFPGGSMTGAPKKRSMAIIDSLESEARGIYSGSIGYLSLNGSADFNIVIRTAVIKGDRLSIGTGGAITALSDPEKEFEEILLKGKALLESLNGRGTAVSAPQPDKNFPSY